MFLVFLTCNFTEGWHPLGRKGLYKSPSFAQLEKKFKTLKPGGAWSPSNCKARHQVAIIIPYRDRVTHLRVLLDVLHPILQLQQLKYRVFVVEQVGIIAKFKSIPKKCKIEKKID